MTATSYNGWLASPDPADFGGLEKLIIAGESFAPGVRAGDVHDVFQYVAEQLHLRVEPVVRADWHQADDWGYSYRLNRNANNLSCHASGTAIDYNSTRHPNGKRGTFSVEQVVTIHRILAEVNDVVRWGGSFTGTADEMHFEVCEDEAAVARVAARLRAPKPVTPKHATVQRGSVGPDVELLQRFLGVAHLGDPGYGSCGPVTEAAIRRYQQMQGLAVDGICGSATWAKIGL
jgi:hypothetical protein